MSEVRFGILGPLEVRVDGEAVTPPTGHRRLVLAGLVCAWGRPVLTDDLVDLLWEDAPPPTARRTLASEVARLRGALRALHPDLAIDKQGEALALVPGPATLDRTEFDDELRTARRGTAAGDHLRVVYAAERGLALWRAPALGDLAGRGFLNGYAVRLDEERAALVELRAQALLHLGRLDELISELGASVAESPLREELRRLLMVALARSGRHPEALRVYEDYRSLLAEEIGVEPSDQLKQLEWRILDHDPLLLAGAGSGGRAREQWQLPPELTVPSPVSVGRAGVRDQLRSALAGVADGGRAMVVVRGELGVGKSHLVAAASREAHDAGAVVLAGACDGDVQAPLGPVVRALRFFREQAGAEGDELVAPWWPELGRLLPEVPREGRSADAGLDPQSERARLFDAVVGWLTAVAEARPVVLVLEDLHWADDTTLLLVKHLMAAPGLRRVLVLATVRDPESRAPDLLDDVVAATRRDGVLAADITLAGLSVDEVAQLIAELRPDLGRDRATLAGALVERTNGNPLFVLELLGEVRGGERVEVLGSPPSAQHLVARRLRQLDATATRVLTDAALIGDDVAFDLLVDVSRTDLDEVLRCLDAPIDLGLLVHVPDEAGGRLRFAHAVVRDALVERLRPAERIDGHRRITAAILRLPEHRRRALVEELAQHASEAAIVDGPLAALPHVLRAGRQALDRRAYSHAARWFARGLALAEDGGVPDGPLPGRASLTRFDVLCALGSAQRRAGDPAFRDTVLAAAELAQAAGDGDGVAEAALVGTRGFFRQTAVPDREWIALLEAAVGTSEASSAATRARLRASLASELVWADPDGRRFGLSDEAVALAREADSPALLGQVLFLRMVTIWSPDNADERLAVAEEALGLAEAVGDRALQCHLLRFGAAAAIEVGDRDGAADRLAACERLTDEVAQPDLAWHLALARAGWSLWSGEIDRAEADAGLALEAGRRAGEPEFFAFTAAVLLEIGRLRGTSGELVAAALELPELPVDPSYGFLRHLAAAGPRDLAATHLRAAIEDLGNLGRGVHTLAALANLADVAARLGDVDAAAALAPRLAPFADHLPQAIVIQPCGHHYLGLLASTLGRADEADGHFARAVELHRALQAPLHEAESLLAWSRRDEGRRLAEAHGAVGLL